MTETANTNRPRFELTEKQFIILLFVLALALRLAYIVIYGREERFIDMLQDQVIYVDVAQNIAAGHGYTLTNPIFMSNSGPTLVVPAFYPILVATVFKIFGPSFLAVRIVQTLLSALTCVVVYFIGKQLVGERVARIGSLILCFYLPVIMYIRPIMTETLCTFLLALSVLRTMQFLERKTVLNAIILGLLWGLSFLVRPSESIFYGTATAIYVLFVLWRNRETASQLRLVHVIAIVLALIVFPGIWGIRNRIEIRAWVFTTSQSWTLWEVNVLRYNQETDPEWANAASPERKELPNFDQLTELERDQALSDLGFTFILEHPLEYVKYGLGRIYFSYPVIPREILDSFSEESPALVENPDDTILFEFPTYTTIFEVIRVWWFRITFLTAIGGMIVLVRQRKWGVLLLMLLVAFNILAAFILRGKERARIFVDPYLILLSAQFLYTAVVFIIYRSRSQKVALEPQA
jgi:4-amino-4-deoxy-L-arabinose transferase-like glycosyltransferase